MPDVLDDLPDDLLAEEGILAHSDAAKIGFKVVEMADRVAKIDPAVPGALAKWGFEMDGKSFNVTVTLAKG